MHFEYRYLYLNKSYLSFNRRYFRYQPTWNKNCLWRPCLLTNRDKMSSLYRGLSIDASYQISVHLGKRFQRRRFFRNQPIRHKNGLWRPCLLANRDEMSNLYRGHSIDASYQVSVHLAEEKIKMWKVNGRRMSSDGKSSHCLWQGELKIKLWSSHISETIKATTNMLQYSRQELFKGIQKLQQICCYIPERNCSKESKVTKNMLL